MKNITKSNVKIVLLTALAAITIALCAFICVSNNTSTAQASVDSPEKPDPIRPIQPQDGVNTGATSPQTGLAFAIANEQHN